MYYAKARLAPILTKVDIWSSRLTQSYSLSLRCLHIENGLPRHQGRTGQSKAKQVSQAGRQARGAADT